MSRKPGHTASCPACGYEHDFTTAREADGGVIRIPHPTGPRPSPSVPPPAAPEQRATAAERLEMVRSHLERGRGAHPLVPYAVDAPLPLAQRIGRCAVCDEPIYESGDYRGGRWRHGEEP